MAQHPARQDGFTLIELLVVIIIIGILSAIAIPSFLAQREKAYRSGALSDMRNVAVVLDTYATDYDGDYSGLDGADQSDPRLTDNGYNATELVAVRVAATATGYCVEGSTTRIPGKTFVLRSEVGKVEILLTGSTTC